MMSPGQVAETLKIDVSTVSYHVKALLRERAVRHVKGTRPKVYERGQRFDAVAAALKVRSKSTPRSAPPPSSTENAPEKPPLAASLAPSHPWHNPRFIHNPSFHFTVADWRGPGYATSTRRPPSTLPPMRLLHCWGTASTAPGYVEDEADYNPNQTSWGWVFELDVPRFSAPVKVTVLRGEATTARFTIPDAILDPEDPLKDVDAWLERGWDVVGAFTKTTGASWDIVLYPELAGYEGGVPAPGSLFAPGMKVSSRYGETWSDSTGPGLLGDIYAITTFLEARGNREFKDMLTRIFLRLPHEVAEEKVAGKARDRAMLRLADRVDGNDADLAAIKELLATVAENQLSMQQGLEALQEMFQGLLQGPKGPKGPSPPEMYG